MLTLRVTLDTKGLVKDLTVLQERQIPFARSLAVNRLGEAFQAAERERLAQVFTLRQKGFIEREGVKRLSGPATKQNPTVTYGVSDRADFLQRFETGQTKTPTSAKHLAIPTTAVRRNKRDIITAGQRPRPLIERFKSKKGAGRVFVLDQKRGGIGPGIFQTTGRKGRGALKFLYPFETSVPTAPVLGFEDTAKAVTSQWPKIFDEAMAFALRTAR